MKVKIGDYNNDISGKRKTKIKISHDDVFSLDCTLAIIIHKSLKEYKKYNNGTPANIQEKEWNSILDKMILAFKIMKKGGHIGTNYPEVDEGLKLFCKYYRTLWI